MNDLSGIVHWNNYPFGSSDALNSGAARISSLGSRVIKVFFNINSPSVYTTNSSWPTLTPFNLVHLANTTYFTNLFDRNFGTFVLVIEGDDQIFCCDSGGMSTLEKDTERIRIRDLALHLMRTYRNTGKTFVFQNWEGDNQMYTNGACIASDGVTITQCKNLPGGNPAPGNVQGMIDWMNSRQAGVNEARAIAATEGISGVKIYNALEVNMVTLARTNSSRTTVTNHVVPHTACDLYSYSVWDVAGNLTDLYHNLLHLSAKAHNTGPFGEHNIVIGEYSGGDWASTATDRAILSRRLANLFTSYGTRYFTYWQLYENTHLTLLDGNGLANETALKLQETFGRTVHRFALRTGSGHYVSPEGGGGWGAGYVYANAPWVKEWEYLTLVDRNGGSLVSGDKVNLLTHKGYFITAVNTGGGDVAANATWDDVWEEFTIVKLNGTGSIAAGDSVAFRTSDGAHYLGATGSGGAGSILVAWGTAVGAWEPFTLEQWQSPATF